MPYRRLFLTLLTAFAAASLSAKAEEPSRNVGKRFNILWLIADQHMQSIMGCAGNPVVKTPNLDALAAAGARFANATCVTPFCSPTRASFISGQYPHTHGIVQNVAGDDTRALSGRYPCVENILFERGWSALHLGKWHLGWERDLVCYPGTETYQESHDRYEKEFLLPAGEKAYDEPRPGEVVSGKLALTKEMAAAQVLKPNRSAKKKAGKAPGAALEESAPVIGRSLVKPDYTYESWLAGQCIRLLEKNKDHNFILTYSISPPHPPFICPAPYYDMYDPATMPWPKNADDRPAAYKNLIAARNGWNMSDQNKREYLRCYYGQVTMVDAIMGRILAALKSLGLEDDTLVIYTSDHGNNLTSHGFLDKTSGSFHEELLRVPLIFRYPGHIRAGSVFQSKAESLDLMPTLLDYAGAPVSGNVQGRSLRPVIEGRAPDVFDFAVCERGLGDSNRFSRMLRTAEAKYCYYSDGSRELFDLAKDPYEMKNVADDPAYRSLRVRLHAMMCEQMKKTTDPALPRLTAE